MPEKTEQELRHRTWVKELKRALRDEGFKSLRVYRCLTNTFRRNAGKENQDELYVDAGVPSDKFKRVLVWIEDPVSRRSMPAITISDTQHTVESAMQSINRVFGLLNAFKTTRRQLHAACDEAVRPPKSETRTKK